MNIKTLTYLLIILAFNTARAQYNSDFANYDNMRRSVSLNGEFDAGSNAMQNAFMNRFIFGGHIDEEMKDNAMSKMRGLNQLGVNLNYDLCTYFGKNPKYDFLLGFKNQEIFNATYTSDFYKLMFYGNKPYLDKTANFEGTNINALRFQELKFGVIMHQVDSNAKIGVSVSFLKGEQLFYVKANKHSSLFTNFDGTELLFQSNFNMALSDTSTKKNVWSFNGVGASADIFFETPYKSKIGKQSVLIINANNIGFIHWLGNSVQYSSDSALKFDGYHINNILDLKDSTLNKINADSMLRSVMHARREEFNTNIPTNLVLINKIYFGQRKFALNTGFRYIFHANYKPYVFIEPEFTLKNNFVIAPHVGYGGYTRLNIGLSLMYNSKSWFIKIGSHSLQGYVAPKIAFGQGFYFSIAKKFK